MLERDRVDLLVDPGTSFLELSLFAADGLYGRDVDSADAFLPMQDEICPYERQKGLTIQA
jgi:acetyl-CoA carboxylase carboxyltransferase component